MEERESIYKAAMKPGAWFGLYLSVSSCLQLLSVRVPLVENISFLMLLIGYVVFTLLHRKLWLSRPEFNKFSTLWLGGIMIVIYATLITGLATALWVTFIEPDYVQKFYSAIMESIAAQPEQFDQLAIANIRNSMEQGRQLKPMDFVISMMWLSACAGVVLSLVSSLSLYSIKRRSKEIAN